MRNWAKQTILASGALRLAIGLRRPSAVILMFHSVLPDPAKQADILGGMAHSEVVFRAQMELLARHFHPISLDEALGRIRNGEDFRRCSVVVTFDDGYIDNYEVAMPILNRTGVPATFYATVDCIANRKLPWPSRLRFAFRNTKSRTWTPEHSEPLLLRDHADRERAFSIACNLCCQLSGRAQESFVNHLEEELAARVSGQASSLMMDWGHLRALTRHGHIVASHTMTHPNMAYLTEDAARYEFTESKRRLESELKALVRHFAYPCPALSPHWSEKSLEQCHLAGYESAVTTEMGITRMGDSPLCLKRVLPTKTLEGLRWNLEAAFACVKRTWS